MFDARLCLVCKGPTVELDYFLPQHPRITLPVLSCTACGKVLIGTRALRTFARRVKAARAQAEPARWGLPPA